MYLDCSNDPDGVLEDMQDEIRRANQYMYSQYEKQWERDQISLKHFGVYESELCEVLEPEQQQSAYKIIDDEIKLNK